MKQVYDVPAHGVDYIEGNVLHVGSKGGGVLVRSESDLAELPAYRPGTLAHTAGYKQIWERNVDGSWVPATN